MERFLRATRQLVAMRRGLDVAEARLVKTRLSFLAAPSGPLLLLVALLGCKQERGTEEPGSAPPSSTPSAASSVRFPSYPATKDGGVLWLTSRGGPLGEQVYSASPTEVGTAITGPPIKPPTTLASAPSIPATTIATGVRWSRSM